MSDMSNDKAIHELETNITSLLRYDGKGKESVELAIEALKFQQENSKKVIAKREWYQKGYKAAKEEQQAKVQELKDECAKNYNQMMKAEKAYLEVAANMSGVILGVKRDYQAKVQKCIERIEKISFRDKGFLCNHTEEAIGIIKEEMR